VAASARDRMASHSLGWQGTGPEKSLPPSFTEGEGLQEEERNVLKEGLRPQSHAAGYRFVPPWRLQNGAGAQDDRCCPGVRSPQNCVGCGVAWQSGTNQRQSGRQAHQQQLTCVRGVGGRRGSRWGADIFQRLDCDV
jgi:hypothetical protein